MAQDLYCNFRQLTDKVAIITGAAQGIGFAIAEAFVREGAKVAICDIQEEGTQDAARSLRSTYQGSHVIGVQTDVTSQESIEHMRDAVLEEWDTVDILVNNAGVTSAKSIFEMTNQDFTRVIDINLVGPFMAIRAIGAVMKGHGGGSIINTSSMVGTYGGRMQTAYSSSKFGVNGLTKSCAKELGPYGIRVNAVAPGVVTTPMMRSSVDENMLKQLSSFTPLGRPANPADLAGAYVYLASDAASFTTGTIIHVDGGIVM